MLKFLLVFLISFCVQADTDWARVAMNTATVLDWAQTRYIAAHPEYYENNKILGPYPSDAAVNRYFVLALLSYNVAGEYLISEKYRAYFYSGVALVHGEAVLQNYNIGLRFRFD